MPSMDVMGMTTMVTGCVWSSLAAAGAPEADLEGSAGRPEADTGLHPDAPSTGSLCRVGKLSHSVFIVGGGALNCCYCFAPKTKLSFWSVTCSYKV